MLVKTNWIVFKNVFAFLLQKIRKKPPKLYVQKVPKICSLVISKTQNPFSVGGIKPLNPPPGHCPGPAGSLERPPDPLIGAYISFQFQLLHWEQPTALCSMPIDDYRSLWFIFLFLKFLVYLQEEVKKFVAAAEVPDLVPNSKSMKLLTSDALQHRQETFQDSTIQCPSPKNLGSSFQGISSVVIT